MLYGKIWQTKGVVYLSFNIKYSICMACTLTVFFIAAFILGNFIRANGYDVAVTEVKETTNATVEVTQRLITDTAVPKESLPTEESYYYNIALSEEKQEYVFSLCEEYSVPVNLVLAVMSIESNYTNEQVSSSGDWGIMQINSINHEWLKEELGVCDFLDFYDNVRCGVYMLSQYYHKYANINQIAMCYRYGETGAKEMWDNGINETEYTKKIIQAIATLSY